MELIKISNQKNMKKTIIILFTGLLLLLVGCSEDMVTIEHPIDLVGKTITINANMPGKNKTTRISLIQNDLDINLAWEPGDQIHLVFNDGTIVVQQTITIGEISNNGRRAEFTVEIPDAIVDNSETSTFDLYGIYGNVTFSTVEGEEGYAVLPSSSWSGTLNEVEDSKIVLIRFEETGVSKTNPVISVNFQHIGSLFKIYLENTGETNLTGITGVELFSNTSGTSLFAHQSTTSQVATFDVINGNFIAGTTEFSEVLPFNYTGDLVAGSVIELWGWYSPSQESSDIWPEIGLRVNYGSDDVYETTVPKSARTATTDIGRAYHFFARFDSALDPALAFTSIVSGSFVDERDGQIYSTVKIGDQIWMAENLKYYPSLDDLVGADDGSSTEPRYYVYGYDGIQPPTQTVIDNFNNYGVLYNWAAAMSGESSSNANPSGVQGICPDGWHLPSEAEWVQLTTFAGTTAGTKLKEAGITYWNESSGVTNEFGFSARGGGSRQAITSEPAGFYNLKINGHWLTSTEVDDDNTLMNAAWMQANSSTGGYQKAPKEYGGSIRCVRD